MSAIPTEETIAAMIALTANHPEPLKDVAPVHESTGLQRPDHCHPTDNILWKLFASSTFHNVNLVGTDKIAVPINRDAVAASNKYFEVLLLGKFAEQTKEVNIIDFNSITITDAIHYFLMGTDRTLPWGNKRRYAGVHTHATIHTGDAIPIKDQHLVQRLLDLQHFGEKHEAPLLAKHCLGALSGVGVITDFYHVLDFQIRNGLSNLEHTKPLITRCCFEISDTISKFKMHQHPVMKVSRGTLEMILQLKEIQTTEGALLDMLHSWAVTNNSTAEAQGLLPLIRLESVRPELLKKYRTMGFLPVDKYMELLENRAEDPGEIPSYDDLRGWGTDSTGYFPCALKVTCRMEEICGIYEKKGNTFVKKGEWYNTEGDTRPCEFLIVKDDTESDDDTELWQITLADYAALDYDEPVVFFKSAVDPDHPKVPSGKKDEWWRAQYGDFHGVTIKYQFYPTK